MQPRRRKDLAISNTMLQQISWIADPKWRVLFIESGSLERRNEYRQFTFTSPGSAAYVRRPSRHSDFVGHVFSL